MEQNTRESERPKSPVTSVISTETTTQHVNQQTETPQSQIPPVEPHPEVNEPLVSDAAEEKPNTTKPSIWKLISKFFVWEVLAMLLSSGLLAVIMVVLARYNNRPQPTWRYVSLNSMISWLSTVSKGCVLFSISEGIGQLKWVWFARKNRPLTDLSTFDGASRGIYGCAGLVWRMKAKHFAALGSVAVILGIAFDPFVQNLIHYYPALIVDPSGTAVVSSNAVLDALGPPLNGGTYYLDPAIKANIYNSIFDSQSLAWSTPRYTCSSGNCTWDPIATIEMRASCTNLTDQLQTKTNTSIPAMPNTAVYLKGPHGNVSADYQGDPINETIETTGTVWGNPVTIASYSPAFVYTNSMIDPIQIIAPDRLPATETWGDTNLPKPKWQAFECNIAPVVRSFRAGVTRGEYHEETLGIWTNGSYESFVGGSNYNFNPPWGADMGVEPNKKFVLTKRSIMSIRAFFTGFFPGGANLTPFGFTYIESDMSIYAGHDMMQLIALSNITSCTTRTAEKLHCAMDNVASAMTKAIRDSNSSSAPNFTTTTGEAKISTTFVTIHWQWIALPVLVWLLGLITLLGTMWKTRRAGIPIWKNETMPLLSVYRDGSNDRLQGDEVLESERVRLYESEGKIVLSG